MILDITTACSMFLEAVLGWGILSPVAKHLGWAPGPTDSMGTGVRGWLIWISIGFLLGDAAARVPRAFVVLALRFFERTSPPISRNRYASTDTDPDPGMEPLIGEPVSESCDITRVNQPAEGKDLVSGRFAFNWFLGSTLLCVICTFMVFRQEIPIYVDIVSITISFPLCLIVIQSAGETDTIPSNSLSRLILHVDSYNANLVQATPANSFSLFLCPNLLGSGLQR